MRTGKPVAQASYSGTTGNRASTGRAPLKAEAHGATASHKSCREVAADFQRHVGRLKGPDDGLAPRS